MHLGGCGYLYLLREPQKGARDTMLTRQVLFPDAFPTSRCGLLTISPFSQVVHRR